LSFCASINSKWIKNLNVRTENLKLLQKRAGNILGAIGIGKDFLSRTQVAQQVRERIDKWDYIKLKKNNSTTREMVFNVKRPPTKWEKIFASYTSENGLVTRIYRKLKKTKLPRINEPVNKWATELNRTFSREEIQMAKTHLKNAHHPWP
jgi:hypothetical protein